MLWRPRQHLLGRLIFLISGHFAQLFIYKHTWNVWRIYPSFVGWIIRFGVGWPVHVQNWIIFGVIRLKWFTQDSLHLIPTHIWLVLQWLLVVLACWIVTARLFGLVLVVYFHSIDVRGVDDDFSGGFVVGIRLFIIFHGYFLCVRFLTILKHFRLHWEIRLRLLMRRISAFRSIRLLLHFFILFFSENLIKIIIVLSLCRKRNIIRKYLIPDRRVMACGNNTITKI